MCLALNAWFEIETEKPVLVFFVDPTKAPIFLNSFKKISVIIIDNVSNSLFFFSEVGIYCSNFSHKLMLTRIIYIYICTSFLIHKYFEKYVTRSYTFRCFSSRRSQQLLDVEETQTTLFIILTFLPIDLESKHEHVLQSASTQLLAVDNGVRADLQEWSQGIWVCSRTKSAVLLAQEWGVWLWNQ